MIFLVGFSCTFRKWSQGALITSSYFTQVSHPGAWEKVAYLLSIQDQDSEIKFNSTSVYYEPQTSKSVILSFVLSFCLSFDILLREHKHRQQQVWI